MKKSASIIVLFLFSFAQPLFAQGLLEGEFEIEFPYPLLGRTAFPTVQELARIAADPKPQVVLLFAIYPEEAQRTTGADRNDYYAPAWSPDGQVISFLRADLKRRTSKIVLLPSLCERRAVTLLESADSYDYMLSWALTGGQQVPTVSYFVFSSTVGPDENLDIYLCAIEGGVVMKPVRLTKGNTLRRYGSLYLRQNKAWLLFCDGPVVKQIDLRSGPDALLAAHQTGDRTGDASGQIGELLSLGYGNYPTWSPDGSAIVYAKQKGEEAGHILYDLYLRGSQGIERPLISEPGLRVRSPTWSPDGRHVAVYAARGEGGWGLYVLDLRAVPATLRQICPNVATEENFDYVGPAWMSAGQGLLYFMRGAQEGGHYPLLWSTLGGPSEGQIEYPSELTTANDLAISPARGVIEAAFVATRRMVQDVYVMIATEPKE